MTMCHPNRFPDSVRAARLAACVLVAVLAGGCATMELARDKYYPADWPDVAGAGEDCRRIEGAFANKGVLVGEAGQRREIWFTDLLGPHYKRDEGKFSAMRTCERVDLTLESYEFTYWSRKIERVRLIVTPSRKITGDPLDRFEACESMHLPRYMGWPFDVEAPFNESGSSSCVNAHLIYSIPENTGGSDWHIGLASDGTLLVRHQGTNVYWIPYLFPIISLDHSWARFDKVR